MQTSSKKGSKPAKPQAAKPAKGKGSVKASAKKAPAAKAPTKAPAAKGKGPAAKAKAKLPVVGQNVSHEVTSDDVAALANSLMEAISDGATDPVAFFITGEDALERELLRRLTGEEDGVAPIVISAPMLRRFALLMIADDLIWQENDRTD